jgi:hypothetical protein
MIVYVKKNIIALTVTKKSLRSLTTQSRVLVEKVVKNFPSFYGTPRLTTTFTRAHCWSLSEAR